MEKFDNYKEYLDSISKNYIIIITDNSSIIYSNKEIMDNDLSFYIKDAFNKIHANENLINYFSNIEEISIENVQRSYNNIKNIDLNNYNKKDFLEEKNINDLVFTEKNIIQITNSNFLNYYNLECILPLNKANFKGALIILCKELSITPELKSAFFRFSKGILFTLTV